MPLIPLKQFGAQIVLAAPASVGTDVEVATLKNQNLKRWTEHDTCVRELGPLLYKLCAVLNAQGQKGAGFAKWLNENKLSRSSAYRWINRYAKKERLELPY